MLSTRMESIQDSWPPDGELTSRWREALPSLDDALEQSEAARITPLMDVSGSRDSLAELDRQGVLLDGRKRFSSTILALQAEREKVMRTFQDEAQCIVKPSPLPNTILRDLEEMKTTLAHSRQAARQAKRQLAQKEAEVEQLLSEKRAVLKSIIEAGPWALWNWIKKEIVEQGLEPGEDFERRWLAWLAAAENAKISSTVPSSESLASGKLYQGNAASQIVFSENDHFANSHYQKGSTTRHDSIAKASLLRIVFSIVLQEGMENLQYVLKKGLFFLPMAWFFFWMGLYSRITWHLVAVISSGLRRSFFPFRFHVI